MRVLISAAVMTALAAAAAAQEIPEGVYSPGRRGEPIEMCGLKADSVLQLAEKARASTELTPVPAGARFELFATENHSYQLTFTRPGEAAYPAATCRHTRPENGDMVMSRTMRCEGTKADCDALFMEFHNLDERVRQAVRDRAS